MTLQLSISPMPFPFFLLLCLIPFLSLFLMCLFLSFFFYFLLFSSDSNTTSHNLLQALVAPHASFSSLLLLFPLNYVSSFPHLLSFAFFSSFLWSVSSNFTCRWVFPLLRFSIFCLLHEVSSVLSFFSIFVVCLFHLHFHFLLWFSIEFLLLCMFSS